MTYIYPTEFFLYIGIELSNYSRNIKYSNDILKYEQKTHYTISKCKVLK